MPKHKDPYGDPLMVRETKEQTGAMIKVAKSADGQAVGHTGELRKLARLLEWDWNVKEFSQDPLEEEVQWQDENGVVHTILFAPDFRVDDRTRSHRYPALVTYIPQRMRDPRLEPGLISMLNRWCYTRHYDLRVVTASDLLKGYLTTNVLYLYKFAAISVSPTLLDRVVNTLESQPALTVTLQSLASRLRPADPESVVPPILNLLYGHDIEADIESRPLSLATVLYLPWQGPRGARVLSEATYPYVADGPHPQVDIHAYIPVRLSSIQPAYAEAVKRFDVGAWFRQGKGSFAARYEVTGIVNGDDEKIIIEGLDSDEIRTANLDGLVRDLWTGWLRIEAEGWTTHQALRARLSMKKGR